MNKETFIGLVRAVEIGNLYRADVNDAGEGLTPVLVMPYGISHNPPIGSRCVGLVIDCDRGNPYGTAYHPLSTIRTLSEGDVALNTTQDEPQSETGTHRILLRQSDGAIVIVSGSGKVTLTQDGKIELSGEIVVEGDLQVNGKIDATGIIESPAGVKSNGVDLATHTHLGVTPGSAATSPPTKTA